MVNAPSPFDLPPDVVARYIPSEEFRQRLRAVEFPVPLGTVVLVFREKQLETRWPPGIHQIPKTWTETLGGLLLGLRPPLHGWLVRTTPLRVTLSQIGGLYSQDNLPFVASLVLTVQVSDPFQFIVESAWGKRQVLLNDLADILSPHAQALLEEEVVGRTAQALADPSLRPSLESRLLSGLSTALQGRGLLCTQLAEPLRLVCPMRNESQRITAEYEALLAREQARSQGKKALEDLLLSQEVEAVRREGQKAALLEERATIFRRIQQLMAQMTQDQALTRERLEQIRREADRRSVLGEEEWRRFLDQIEVARQRDAYQKRVALEVARMEADYQLKEARLRMEGQWNQTLQEQMRQQKEQELQWRIRQVRLEEEAETARLEAEEHRKTLRLLEEQKRQLEQERHIQELRLLEEEYRRRRQSMEEALRRESQKQEELLRLEQERLRALQEQELRQQAQERQADLALRTFQQMLHIIIQKVKEYPSIEPGFFTASMLVAFPQQQEAISQITRLMYGARLSEGKIALLEGNTQGFIKWVEEHYRTLGETLRATPIKTLEDVLAVVDRFLAPPPPRVAPSHGWPSVVEEARHAVFPIQSVAGMGTAFAVETHGKTLLVTSAHLMGDVKEPSPACFTAVIYTPDKRVVPVGLLRWLNDERDLAVLAPLEALDLRPLRLAPHPPRLGEAVGALGFPAVTLTSLRGASPRFTQGVLAGFKGTLLDFTAAVNPGNSGGPLLSPQGQVVGVVAGFIPWGEETPIAPSQPPFTLPAPIQAVNLAIPAPVVAEAVASALPALERPHPWASLRTPDGLLALYPRGQWQVEQPPRPGLPLRILSQGVEVVARPTPPTADAGEALVETLKALAPSLSPLQWEEGGISRPYWVERVLTRPDALLLFRWEPPLERGVVALARPLPTTPGQWHPQAFFVLQHIYLA